MAESPTVILFPIIARIPYGIDLARQTQVVSLNDRARVVVLPCTDGRCGSGRSEWLDARDMGLADSRGATR